MFRYLFISLFVVLSVSTTFAQQLQDRMQSVSQATSSKNKSDDDDEAKHKPRITVMKDQGFSVGIDVSPFIMRIFQKENTGFAFVGRYGFKYKWWANAEVGFQNTKYSNQNFSYKANGTFIKIGVDYDIFHSETFPVNDNVFVGVRYGYSWQMHEADNFKVVDTYWGGYEGSVGNSAVNSHIIEALFGIRCEVFKNFYMGWSVRGRFLLASVHDDSLDPYTVAGYGKYDSKAGLGFTYTFEYQIPFNKFGKKNQ